MADEFGEKTEAPTPRRRQEIREEGNVARSTDLVAALLLLAAVLGLAATGPRIFLSMQAMVNRGLENSGDVGPIDPKHVSDQIQTMLGMGAKMAAPLVLGLAALAILIGTVQSGFLFTTQPLAPKLSRVSPLKGMGSLFSMRALLRFAMSLAKVGFVLAVAGVFVRNDLAKLLSLVRLEAGPLAAATSELVWSLAIKVALVLVVLGLIDLFYQRWQHEKDLRMTKQEVREEFKRMEGDPLVKQRRAKVARQLMLQRIQQDVPRADVVVTNPTHFAVALEYGGGMNAPKVIAKGADYLAIRIRHVAAAHGVPIVERPPLARALYSAVEVGQEIPPQHYAAVAEILAYVYRLTGRKSA